jgi:hypothetical protein
MTREELECAIRKPAEKIQLEFEPGLVRRILNDVGDELGNLPLELTAVAHALVPKAELPGNIKAQPTGSFTATWFLTPPDPKVC